MFSKDQRQSCFPVMSKRTSLSNTYEAEDSSVCSPHLSWHSKYKDRPQSCRGWKPAETDEWLRVHSQVVSQLHASLIFLKKLRLWLSARLKSGRYFGGKKVYSLAHHFIVNGWFKDLCIWRSRNLETALAKSSQQIEPHLVVAFLDVFVDGPGHTYLSRHHLQNPGLA